MGDAWGGALLIIRNWGEIQTIAAVVPVSNSPAN